VEILCSQYQTEQVREEENSYVIVAPIVADLFVLDKQDHIRDEEGVEYA
jgi:hypothetical protein